MRSRLCAFLPLIVLILVPSAAHAQATLAGTVRDASGAVLPGVTIEASSPALIEKVRSATTDASGQYRITNLPVGTYSVTFTLEGFARQQQNNVVLTTGFTASVNGVLTVGQRTETVTVSGEAPTVDVRNATQTATFAGEDIGSREIDDGMGYRGLRHAASADRCPHRH